MMILAWLTRLGPNYLSARFTASTKAIFMPPRNLHRNDCYNFVRFSFMESLAT